MIDSLEFMWAGGNTARYHTQHTLKIDTVGHHSYNVVCIIMVLRPNASAALLRAGLKHDMAEHRLGDMPAPAKRRLPDYGTATFRETWGQLEEAEMRMAGIAAEKLTDEEAWLLKLADSMDGMRFCIQERRMGNTSIAEIYKNFEEYVAALLFGPEVKSALLQCEEALLEPATFTDYKLFRYLKGEWYDLCK